MCIRVYMYTYVYIHTYILRNSYIYIYIHTYIHTYIHRLIMYIVTLYLSLYIYIYMIIYIYIYMYMYVYVYIYIYIERERDTMVLWYSLWRRGFTCSFQVVSRETPDVTPCRTSPSMPVCLYMSRAKRLTQHHVTPHRRRVFAVLRCAARLRYASDGHGTLHATPF